MADARFDAVVIGAGVNGLTAAATLARAGRRVVVLEAGDAIGGQAQPIEFAPGFRAPLSADTGWLPPNVASGLGINVAAVSPTMSVSVVHDGAVHSLPSNAGDAASVIRQHSSRDAGRWPAFTTRLGTLAGFLGALYQSPPPDVDGASLSDFASLLGLGRKFRGRSGATT